MTRLDDKEFLEMIRKHDCPDTLIKMANNPWQKQVAVEVVLLDKRLGKHEHEIATLKRITWSVFVLTAVACVVQVINTLVIPLL